MVLYRYYFEEETDSLIDFMSWPIWVAHLISSWRFLFRNALGILKMTTLVELVIVFLSSFGFNLIPFAGPSNLFIASNLALMLGNFDPIILITIGFLVALGAALAKSVHYLVTFFVSKRLSEKQRQRLDAEALKVKKWAALLLFTVAVTPIPDEPVIIPLGLMKYSPVKFISVYFLGKLCITVIGAFLGAWTGTTLSEWLTPVETVVLSIILTIVITVIMLKVDFGKLGQRLFKKKPTIPGQQPTRAVLRKTFIHKNH